MITDFDEGISLEWGANNNTIMNSTISSNDYGIYIIAFSNGNTIVDNNILDNNQAGVVISNCESGGYCPGGNTNNTLQGNLIVNNSIGIYSNGSTSIINSNVVCGNTNQDIYSSDWQSSSGDNNTCDCTDGWNDNSTTGCSKSCFIQYPDTFSFIEVPDPLSGDNPTYPPIPKDVPVIGESFYDLRFGTILTRVTQIDGTNGRHEYSRFDPFNVDQSMIVMTLEGDWMVYSTQKMPYNQNGNLVTTLIDLEDPRWDSNDPDLIWGLQDFLILTVNVKTGQTTTIKDFSRDPTIGPIITAEPDLWRITMRNEGESSMDKRFWAFFLQGTNEDYRVRYIFTWDRQQDKVLGVYPILSSEAEIDWVGMSPLGSWVLIGGDPWNGGNLTGLTMANKELTQFHRLDYATAHSDVGLDSNGNEVIVMQNTRTDYIDLIPIDLNTQPILESGGSYENTNRTPIVQLFYSSESPYGLQSGVHISCNVPGYCVVSTYIEPELREQNWLDRTIILVRLDRQNPRAFYLAKVYGTTGAYWEEAHATITNDGSKVVWASNWNRSVGEEKVFLMQLDMPPNWEELIIPATAATYYVAPSGNDSNPGTISQPWRTIQHAAGTLVAGETALIRNGTYNEQVSTMRDGDATDGYIVFSAYPGETPIIDGTGVTTGNNGFWVEHSYTKLVGLEIRNWNDNGIWMWNADHIEISDCEVHDVWYGIGAADGTHDFELNRVEMHHFTGYGFDVSPSGGADCYNGTFNDCIAHTGRDPEQNVDGFALGHGTQHDFIFNHCEVYEVYDGFDISARNTTLNCCSAHDCCWGGYKIWQDNVTLVNCLGYHNNVINVELDWDGEPGTTTLQNGNFVDGQTWNVGSENAGDSLHMYNCILAGGDNIGLAHDLTGNNYQADYNIFHCGNPTRAIVSGGYEDEFSLEQIAAGEWTDYGGQDAHSLVAFDPDTQLFRNLSGWDLHLREGSIAINNGTSQGAPLEDYDGNPRPQGAGYDIGCYEFISTPAFDTGAGSYRSILGTHEGKIIPSCSINVSRLYTYPCAGTGGHTESIELYDENGELIANGSWNGY